MAAKYFYRQGFLLLLFNFISIAALEKRFSDFKRCADEECSMLLCRGKAVKDFSGPDCRFLSFKESETIYVYYKLSGRRADMWAGSVGSNFGYFPMDLIAVNHLYTEQEIEVPAEETDFVCFDTGFDKFSNYDIDLLLSSSPGENDTENEGISVQSQVAESAPIETPPSADEVTDGEEQTEHQDNSEDFVPDHQSASLPEHTLPDMETESPSTSEIESETAVTADENENLAEDTEVPQKGTGKIVQEHFVPESNETKDIPAKLEVDSMADVHAASEKQPVTISEELKIPELKTTLGTTFDAVTSDEEITKHVTPYEEEERDNVRISPEDDVDVKVETPLLSLSEEAANTPASDDTETHESPPTAHDDNQESAKEKNMWTSIGDAVFSVVTGGETTGRDFSSEEDEEDDEENPPSVELPVEPEDIEPALQDPPANSAPNSNTEANSDSEKLSPDHSESEGEVIGPEETLDETLEPVEASTVFVDPVSQEDPSPVPEALNPSLKTAEEPPEYKEEEEEEMVKGPEVDVDNAGIQDSSIALEHSVDLDNDLAEDKMMNDQELAGTDTQLNPSPEEMQSETLEVKLNESTVNNSMPVPTHDHLLVDLESNKSQPELSVEEHEEIPLVDMEDDKMIEDTKVEEEEENEQLLEDENALSFSQSNNTDSEEATPETPQPLESTQEPEPEFSDSVMRLTLLRDHFTEEKMEQVQKLLGLKNLFKVEAMFSDLDMELQATRRSNTGTIQDIENALESILEASENTILDEIEKMLDSQGTNHNPHHQMDASTVDEETEILDDFQELAFSLRQKYSTASDSTPVAAEKEQDIYQDEHGLNVKEDTPPLVEEAKADSIPEAEGDDNHTSADHKEMPTETKDEQVVLEEVQTAPDITVEEDGGHFNKNKDNQPSFSTSDETHKGPQATLESPLDVGPGVEVDHSSSASEIHEEVGLFSTGVVYVGCILSMIKSKIVEWSILIISLLPEEWKPGETFYGCPWQAVVITALVGVVSFTLFFWRTVLAVKKKEYLVDENKLTEQIQALKKEKNDALTKMSELQKQTELLKENQKQSKEKVSCTMKRVQDLESKVLDAQTLNDSIAEEKNQYAKLLEEEREACLQNKARIEKLEKSNEKLQLSKKKCQEALAKTTVLLDEAKIREDARNVQHKCLEKDYTALKEENKNFKVAIKDWEEKHKELNEQIKVYQKSQKELEDSVVLKDHNVEVLSELLADLDACDSQKGDINVLLNGEVAPDKKTVIKNRIKQMMDVSRVQTTLSVVEEERDRIMTKLLNEEKTRKSLEEQHQELEHAIATLKSEKSHVENQFKILQQKNEIMVEMYQQKENTLQQRLTKEELERRSKENMLTEVGGKALEAEEQVKVLRQRINEMEEQMKKTEEVYKEQIKEQENKTHSNWVNARNAERALNQEKLESSKLREKLAVLTSQLNERRAPLFRPNSGQPAGPRQGDSYGPSPVSGGAPSPPLMIEGPRRPPSAPVGRRIDPYGPRPPSDSHGRYAENKHISGMDMMGPRSSSPANMDVSTQAVDPQIKAETQAEVSTDNPQPGPGSFLASPIRDSPGPGPHDQHLPPGPPPLGRLPPPGPYRPPRPGGYPLPPGPHGPPPPPLHGPPLPANGHPGMPLPGPVGGEFGPRPTNGHAFHPRLGPGLDPRGPPPPHFRPPPPHHFGPMPPGVRGPMGPRPPIPPDMRLPGSRDHTSPPVNLPPGVHPHPAHGDTYGQAPPNALQYPTGDHSGPRQDANVKQEGPQDSVRPAMAEP